MVGNDTIDAVRKAHRILRGLPSGHPFTNVLLAGYWSGSTYAGDTDRAWMVQLRYGTSLYPDKDNISGKFWPVRGGQRCFGAWGALNALQGGVQRGETSPLCPRSG